MQNMGEKICEEIKPPIECPEIPPEELNAAMEPAAYDICEAGEAEFFFLTVIGSVYSQRYNCPECIVAWYAYRSCTCIWPWNGYNWYGVATYVFIGCTDDESIPPDCIPTLTESDAKTLAFDYGFNPARKEGPARLRIQNTGKYEPDGRRGQETRSIILASYLDKTNILIQYRPNELEPLV